MIDLCESLGIQPIITTSMLSTLFVCLCRMPMLLDVNWRVKSITYSMSHLQSHTIGAVPHWQALPKTLLIWCPTCLLSPAITNGPR